MFRKTYCDYGQATNGCKTLQRIINKRWSNNQDFFIWNCEEDYIDDENYHYNKVA